MQVGGWQVCVPGNLQVWGSGPLQVCGLVGQVWNVPLQVWGRMLPQPGLLHVGMLLQTPAVPLHAAGEVLLQVPTKAPLHAPVTAPLQAPVGLTQTWAMPLHD